MARRPCTVEARKVIRWLQERDDMIRRGVRDSPLKWLFLVAVFVHAIPLLIVEYVPSVDLPNHVLAAAVAINSDGFYPVGPLAFDWVLSPYILFTALMVVLLPIFGAIWATKIVLLAYVIGLPLSVLAYLRAFNRNNWPLAFMVFPFVYSYHFEYGFIQYCLGIPLVFLTLSVCKNVMDRIDSRASVLLAAGLAMAVYLSHWVNFLAFLVGFVCLIVPLRKRHDLDTMPMPRGRERVSVLMKGLAIITPPLVLFAIYLSQVWSRSQGRDLIKADLHYRSIVWQLLEPMRTLMSSSSLVLDILQIVVLVTLTLWAFLGRKTESCVRRGLLPFSISMIVLVMLVPGQSFLGSWGHNSRFVIFAYVALISCIALPKTGWRSVAPLIMSLLVVTSTVFRAGYYQKTDLIAKDYLSALQTVVGKGKNVYNFLVEVPNPRLAGLPVLLHTVAYYHVDSGGYSPFLFDHQPHVSGLYTREDLPKGPSYSGWLDVHPEQFYDVLSHWDYLAVIHCGRPVPEYLAKLDSLVVYRGSTCTIYTTEGAFTQKPTAAPVT